MGDVGHHRALGGINRSLWRENAVHAEGFHEPPFLVLGFVAGTCHRAGMAYGARQLGLPTADYARHDWLAEFETVLVVATRFRIEYRRLAARITAKRVGKITRRVMDIDVLARRDERRRSPSFRRQILCDSGREAAGIREERHRALDQHLFGIVAAKCATD